MICKVCNSSIGNQELQSLININGKINSAHYICGFKWASETIVVYEINCNGSSYIEKDLNSIADMIQDSDFDEPYTITKVKINQQEYNNLPEFKGF